MSINKLFNEFQSKYDNYDLNGEFTLFDDNIVWSYKIDDMSEVYCDESNEYSYDDDCVFFETMTIEEQLQETYDYDNNKINQIIENFDGLNKWYITDPEICNNTISFTIYRD